VAEFWKEYEEIVNSSWFFGIRWVKIADYEKIEYFAFTGKTKKELRLCLLCAISKYAIVKKPEEVTNKQQARGD